MKTCFILFLTLCSISFGYAQTVQPVADIEPGMIGSDPCWLTAYKNKLYFFAKDNKNGRELWSYDGVNAPTLVYNFNPGSADGCTTMYDTHMAVFQDKLYLPADKGNGYEDLYSYDGVNAPTIVLSFMGSSYSSGPRQMCSGPGFPYLMFTMTTTGGNQELYRYGAFTVGNLYSASTSISNLKACGNRVWFNALLSTGRELVAYDTSGILGKFYTAIMPGNAKNCSPMSLTELDGSLYFSASVAPYGRELYVSDKNSLVPRRLTDLNASGDGIPPVTYGAICSGNGKVYFTGTTNGADFSVYQYDPSNSTTTLLASGFAPYNPPTRLTYHNGWIYFTGLDTASGGFKEIWRTNGTITTQVTQQKIFNSNPTDLYPWNGSLYFNGWTSAIGFELFRISDAAAAVENVFFDGHAVLFPNPATTGATLSITLKQAQNLQLTLWDGSGKTVWTAPPAAYNTGTTSMPLPIGALPAGNYFYCVQDTKGRRLAAGNLVKQ